MTDYQFYKRMGVCPRCKEKIDGKTILCKRCSEIANEYTKAHRKMLVSIGVCPVCRKEKLPEGRKQCELCRQKNYEIQKTISEKKRRKYRKTFNKKQKTLYKYLSIKGICTRCKKEKALIGKKKCQNCLEKDREWHRLNK